MLESSQIVRVERVISNSKKETTAFHEILKNTPMARSILKNIQTVAINCVLNKVRSVQKPKARIFFSITKQSVYMSFIT